MDAKRELCDALHRWLHGRRRFGFPFEPGAIPLNGIYLLFETDQLAHGGDRVVRVGTHTGQNQLRARLTQHFLFENKDRSIFRKNIGRALLAQACDPFGRCWEYKLVSRLDREQFGALVDRAKQQEVERAVSDYIRTRFTFTVLEVPDKARRLRLESRLVSTLSLCEGCRPSPGWLGSSSPKDKIRESGLWQVNELYKEPLTEDELLALTA